MLGKSIFTYEELLTILCECEKVVNSRPLTYLSEDMQDCTLITPAMVLFGRSTAMVKYLEMWDANHFRKRLRFRAKVIEELRKRFKGEYLGKDGLVRTVKLKTQYCALIRPIQCVYPLEVSRNDVKSLPLRKVELTESSVNSTNPDSSEALVKSPISDFSNTNQPQMTICGLAIKRSKRLNLLTLSDVLE
ncbi:hypothetical protein AVEN_169950-1 [Araneus ventricosus]|uniref:DUF5641 domain-containing protein n=1 Tax=Araneus ventricosus TaxID=182803 RepID=A0A4Y2JBL5_ARAVE|nr:hypothetical protein AVEN_169950-1 [Araneus ventricosus]